MSEQFKVVRECKGGEFKVGQIVTVNQEINYDLWQYVLDKIKEGAMIPYVEPVKAVQSYPNKAMSSPNIKILD